MIYRCFIFFALFMCLAKSGYGGNINCHNYNISLEVLLSLPDENEKFMSLISVIEKRMSEIGAITVLNIDKNILNFTLNTELSSERVKYILSKQGIFSVKDETGNKIILHILYAYCPNSDFYKDLEIKFSDKDTKDFENITEKNIKKKLSFMLDDKVLTEPIVMEKISDGNVRITFGYDNIDFNPEDMAVILRNGILSSEIKITKFEGAGDGQ